MAWIPQFKLGRPGAEQVFDYNAMQMDITESQVAASNRVLSGRLKKRVFRTTFPIITLQADYFTVAQRNLMASLLGVTDTFLSFIVRDSADLKMTLEQNYPTDAFSVPLAQNSATLLSAALVAAGVAASISILGVYDNPSGTGTEYYAGGSYNSATYTVTLGTPLIVGGAPAYITYGYSGWLVEMNTIGYTASGGRIDAMTYSGWTLTGV